jgi:hypothetical protein
MHFIKTVVSLFAFSSFAAARLDGSDSDLVRREMAEAAHEGYLAARDEYIEKRELFRRVSLSPSPFIPYSSFSFPPC